MTSVTPSEFSGFKAAWFVTNKIPDYKWWKCAIEDVRTAPGLEYLQPDDEPFVRPERCSLFSKTHDCCFKCCCKHNRRAPNDHLSYSACYPRISGLDVVSAVTFETWIGAADTNPKQFAYQKGGGEAPFTIESADDDPTKSKFFKKN